MNICLIGNGISNLLLAKTLLNKNLKVDLFYKHKKFNNKLVRTIGISNKNIKFIEQNDIPIKKILWPINKIKIFNDSDQDKEILSFYNTKNPNFSIGKNNKIYNLIKKSIKTKKNFTTHIIKKKNFYSSIIKNKNYDLIINSEPNNEIVKNLFQNKIFKNYNSCAYATIIIHEKCKNNHAIQIFTEYGPLAFLPVSNTETSIVFSLLDKKYLKNEKQIKNLVYKYNKFYKINYFKEFEKFNLGFSSLKKYYHKNILCFGDCIHQIHPLAGQGLNMTLRDIKTFSNLIDERLALGLQLDSSLFEKFQKESKHLNFIFASGIDFIHEFFLLDNKFKNKISKTFFKILDKNYLFKKYISEFADKGLKI